MAKKVTTKNTVLLFCAFFSVLSASSPIFSMKFFEKDLTKEHVKRFEKKKAFELKYKHVDPECKPVNPDKYKPVDINRLPKNLFIDPPNTFVYVSEDSEKPLDQNLKPELIVYSLSELKKNKKKDALLKKHVEGLRTRQANIKGIFGRRLVQNKELELKVEENGKSIICEKT